MTPSEVLVPGALAILFVVAWFILGLVDATRTDPAERPSDALPRGGDDERGGATREVSAPRDAR
jgi:hypothetical protein